MCREQCATANRWSDALVIVSLTRLEMPGLIKCCRAIPSLYQVTLMIFALSGAVTMWKETEGLTGAKLLKVLIMDQVLYFMMYVSGSK